MNRWLEHLKRAIGPLRAVFMPVAIVFLAVAAFASADVIGQLVSQVRLSALALVVLTWASLHLVAPLTTLAILRGFGSTLPFTRMLAIHVDRLPTRYLPGGIWHTVSRAVDLHSHGVGKAELSVLVLLENAVPLAVALAGAGLCLWLAAVTSPPALPLLAAGVLLLATLPWATGRAIRSAPRLPVSRYLQVVLCVAAFWAIAAAAFTTYLNAFPGTSLAGKTLQVWGVYLLSWAAGFLAVFAPQGLGVFEAVAGLMLQGALPFASIALLIAGFRACMLFGDLLAYVVGRLAMQALRARAQL